MVKLRRTMLFIPGNNPGMVQNAPIMGADSVIFDLEDAISLGEKDSARILVREAMKKLDFTNVEVVVRINPLENFGYEDIDVISRIEPQALLVPKAEEDQMRRIHSMLDKIESEEGFQIGTIKLMPIIESAYAVENVYRIIKSSSRITAALLGAEDLTADMGIKRTKEGEEIFFARNKIAVACRAARIHCIDTPYIDTDDYEGLKRDTEKGKALGMVGKAVINPRQIDTVHEVFAPTDYEISQALRILETQERARREGKGVFALDGKMVDAPIINRAITIVDTAKLIGLL